MAVAAAAHQARPHRRLRPRCRANCPTQRWSPPGGCLHSDDRRMHAGGVVVRSNERNMGKEMKGGGDFRQTTTYNYWQSPTTTRSTDNPRQQQQPPTTTAENAPMSTLPRRSMDPRRSAEAPLPPEEAVTNLERSTLRAMSSSSSLSRSTSPLSVCVSQQMRSKSGTHIFTTFLTRCHASS